MLFQRRGKGGDVLHGDFLQLRIGTVWEPGEGRGVGTEISASWGRKGLEIQSTGRWGRIKFKTWTWCDGLQGPRGTGLPVDLESKD